MTKIAGIDGVLRDALPGELPPPAPEPPTPAPVYDPFKLLDALTEAEAETFEAALTQPPSKQRLLWQKSRLLDSAHPDWSTFEAMLRQAFPTRADEILTAARI